MTKPAYSSLTARILKALGIFGSIEVLTMLCAVIRTKFVALWIGTAGVGVLSLFNSSIELFKSLTQFNLRLSAVRDISASDEALIPCAISATRRLGVIIGIVSAILMAALSPVLSLFTFGTADHTAGFMLLSAVMCATAVTAGRQAILQGLGRLSTLARASLAAAVISTAVTLPLYYYFRIDAIVPSLLVFAFATLTCMLVPRLQIDPTGADIKIIKSKMRTILHLGGYLTAAMAVTALCDYGLRIYLRAVSDMETVGIYQAGNTIIVSYVGMIFSAMAMEYYPRLSASGNAGSWRTSTVVGHEIGVITALLAPISIIFIAADDLAVRILYSESFMGTLPYVTVAMAGMTLRGASWCMAYLIMARGDGRAYVVTETVAAIITFVLGIAGWHMGGMAGMGIAYATEYALYTLITWYVCHSRYGLHISTATVLLVAVSTALVIGAALLKISFGRGASLLPLLIAVPLSYRTLIRPGVRGLRGE